MPPQPPSDPRDDAALVAAINDGDTRAFEALYFRYRDWVYNLAWRFTANREDALDTLQETFAYLLRKRTPIVVQASLPASSPDESAGAEQTPIVVSRCTSGPASSPDERAGAKRERLELTARMTTFLYPVVKHTATRIRQRHRRERSAGDLARNPASHVHANPGGPNLANPADPNDLPVLTTTDDPTDSLNDLRAILASLPADQQEITLMRFIDDMTLPEIAATLDIPLGTAKSRLHHALRKLRESPALHRHFQP
jgi:RNA polymerase sigma-70 factor (ECF subfamily)